jgi:DNA ligase-1
MATERSIKAKALQDKAKDNVMLAHKFSHKKHVITPTNKRQVSIKDWMIFEKLDGVRAVYKEGKLYSRYGNEFFVPARFIKKIEDNFLIDKTDILDGELISNKGFQYTTSVVRDQSKKATMNFWKDITFTVFDLISYDKKEKFIDRYMDLAMSCIVTSDKNVNYLKKLGTVQKIEDVTSFHNYIKNSGGEGLMLRNPNGLYTVGRSWDLLKVKEFMDEEATVIGYIPGEGRNENRIGGVQCEFSNGIKFDCGTGFTDKDRANPPKIGSKITVRFFELTNDGKPRFPVYVSERNYE